MTTTTAPLAEFDFATFADEDTATTLAVSTLGSKACFSIADDLGRDSNLVSFPIEDIAGFLGAKLGEPAEIERSTYLTDEKVVRDDARFYTVNDLIFGENTMKIQAGGLGNNLILNLGGATFRLGLATIEAIVKDAGLKPSRELTIEDPEPAPKTDSEIEAELSQLPARSAVVFDEPLDLKEKAYIRSGETAKTIVRASEDDYHPFFVPGGGGSGGKWWLREDHVRELGLTADDFTETYSSDWLNAEVIRAELDGERVFANKDEDGDWLIYGGERDGDYVMSYDAEDEFSDVVIVKA